MRIILTQDEIIEACEAWLTGKGFTIEASQLLDADDRTELNIEIELSAEMVEPLKA
jgi:hypothetical protein